MMFRMRKFQSKYLVRGLEMSFQIWLDVILSILPQSRNLPTSITVSCLRLRVEGTCEQVHAGYLFALGSLGQFKHRINVSPIRLRHLELYDRIHCKNGFERSNL